MGPYRGVEVVKLFCVDRVVLPSYKGIDQGYL